LNGTNKQLAQWSQLVYVLVLKQFKSSTVKRSEKASNHGQISWEAINSGKWSIRLNELDLSNQKCGAWPFFLFRKRHSKNIYVLIVQLYYKVWLHIPVMKVWGSELLLGPHGPQKWNCSCYPKNIPCT